MGFFNFAGETFPTKSICLFTVSSGVPAGVSARIFRLLPAITLPRDTFKHEKNTIYNLNTFATQLLPFL